jgi:hypothetical protein
MNKTLVKRLVYELTESVIRLDAQIQHLEQTAPVSTLPYITVLKKALAPIQKELIGKDPFIKSLFLEEGAVDETSTDKFFKTKLPKIRQEIQNLAQALFDLDRGQIQPETELFIRSLALKKLLPNCPELIVLPGETKEDATYQDNSFELEFLPLLTHQNPLAWVKLTDAFSKCFYAQTLKIKSAVEKLNLSETEEEAIIGPIISLRILGPAFYANYILKALEDKNNIALSIVEPILFQELNRFGLVNKDIVILHQSLESSRSQFTIAEGKATSKRQKEINGADELLKAVEKAIPEKLAFNEKSLLRSQLLEERLALGMMISAVPNLNSPAQLRDDLANIDEETPIYPLLGQLQESPATPIEIINAGWLYKLDNAIIWLSEALEDKDTKQAWDTLKQRILSTDILLLKSIEISEVHRVLTYSDITYPVSV